MIDGIFIIIVCFIIFILLQMIKMIEEVKDVLTLAIVSGLCFYISSDVTNVGVSLMFGVIGIACIILIPTLLLIKYIEKMV